MNNNLEGVILCTVLAAMALVGHVLLIVGAILGCTLIILVSVLSLLSLGRWSILGRFTLEPAFARGFLGGGIAGAAVAMLVWFVLVLSGHDNQAQYWPGYIVNGYVLGILGFLWILNDERPQEDVAAVTFHSAPHPSIPRPQRETTPEFRYASWNDEESWQ